LLGCPIDQDPLRSDPVVDRDQRAKCERRPAELERDVHLVFEREAEAAVFGRGRHTEQSELAHVGEQLGRDGVFFFEAFLVGDQLFADEAAERIEELGEGLAIHGLPVS
jgi:hypothetical protein